MTDKNERIRVKKSSKVSIWLYKEQYGFKTMAEALEDYLKKTKRFVK